MTPLGIATQPTHFQSPLPRVRGYRLFSLVGVGGVGIVYAALHSETGRVHAVKILGRDIFTAESRARFNRQRRILKWLDHPDIARLVDFGETVDQMPYIAMEYVQGQNITDYCRSHRLDLPARVGLVRRVCRAVSAAHQNGVVHGGLKPTNILVRADGRPKLLDFGISKLATQSEASDVHSLGVILRALCGGDQRLSAVVARATGEQPGCRYRSAEAMAQELDNYLDSCGLEVRLRPRLLTRAAIS